MPTPKLIYLDNCCLNRPFDNQSQDRIRLETEALTIIMDKIRKGSLAFVYSDIIEYELRKHPNPQKRERVELFLHFASKKVLANKKSFVNGKIYTECGLKNIDALHIACAEQAKASAFLTTDDKIIKSVARSDYQFKVDIKNPLDWLKDTYK